MSKQQECVLKKTSIGGQALIEGIMMRGPKTTAMAVRDTEGNIVLEEWATVSTQRAKIFRIPFVRDEEGNTHYITEEIEALNSMDSFRKAAMPLLANWVSSIAESPAPTWEEGKVPDPVDAVRAYLFETFMSGTAFVSLGHGEDAYYLPVITPKNIKNVLK